MKNGKIFLFSLLCFLFLAGGCSLFRGNSGLQPEAALLKDSFVVMSLDYSNEQQRAQFKNLMERFPENPWLDKLLKEDEFLTLKPIFEGEWKVVFGAKVKGEKVEQINDENFEFYIVGKFSEADKLEAFFDKEIGKQKEINDVKYWLDNGDFVTRYGDFFILGQSEPGVKGALERLKDEDGFSPLESGNLGYAFVDVEKMYPFAGEFKDVVKGMESVTMMVSANDKGLSVDSKTEMKEGEKNPYIVADYVPGLLKKIPGGEIISFGEQGSLKPIFGFLMENLGEQILQEVANFAQVETAEVEAIVDSPAAFALSYVNEFYPGVAIYLDLEESEIESGRKIALAADQYVDEVFKELEGFLEAENMNVKDLFKKEPVVVKGGGMHKVYLDWSNLKDEDLAALNVIPGIDLKTMKVELYYGVTGDNVFVFALYPGFDKAYGSEVLADNDEFKKAIKNFDLGFSIGFFQTGPLVKLADKYFEVAKNMGMLKPEEADIYQSIRKSVETIKYTISTNQKVDQSILGKALIVIEKIK